MKADASRDYYLGHSVKAVTGRWAKGKDVFWYTREKAGEGEDMRARELAMVKQREEELMAEVGLTCAVAGRRACVGGCGGRVWGWVALRRSTRHGLIMHLHSPINVHDKTQCADKTRAVLPAMWLQAMGIKPKAPKPLGQSKLDKTDMDKLMAKGEGEQVCVAG